MKCFLKMYLSLSSGTESGVCLWCLKILPKIILILPEPQFYQFNTLYLIINLFANRTKTHIRPIAWSQEFVCCLFRLREFNNIFSSVFSLQDLNMIVIPWMVMVITTHRQTSTSPPPSLAIATWLRTTGVWSRPRGPPALQDCTEQWVPREPQQPTGREVVS